MLLLFSSISGSVGVCASDSPDRSLGMLCQRCDPRFLIAPSSGRFCSVLSSPFLVWSGRSSVRFCIDSRLARQSGVPNKRILLATPPHQSIQLVPSIGLERACD